MCGGRDFDSELGRAGFDDCGGRIAKEDDSVFGGVGVKARADDVYDTAGFALAGTRLVMVRVDVMVKSRLALVRRGALAIRLYAPAL